MQTSPQKPLCGVRIEIGPVEASCMTQEGHRAIIHISKVVTATGLEVTVSWRATQEDVVPLEPVLF